MNHTTIDNIARQERTRREILNKSDLIPTLPDLVLRVIDLLNRGDTEPQELERHIQYDQVLVAKLLGLVNSPFYAVNRKITTVSGAIMVLGFRGLRSLVLASSTSQFMARDFSTYGHNDRGLWLHALTTATAARTLAKEAQLGSSVAEELFVAGLLHDVGKMLVLPYLLEANVPPCQPDQDFPEIERNTVGVDHTEAGALVCAKWNLTDDLQIIIKNNHSSDLPDGLERETAIVRLADAYAHEVGHGYDPERTPKATYQQQDFEAVGIDPDTWDEIKERIDVHVESALDSLKDICS